MKIAIVHDYFIQQGGAEKVAQELHDMFPSSTLVTTVDIHQKPGIVTSWLRHLKITEKNHRFFFLLYPLAVETLNLTEYDLIISSSSGYAKGVRKRKDAIHICYCHTPMRWVWRFEAYAERENFGGITKRVLPVLLALLKRWDLAASRRPDYYIANSGVVADRIAQAYGRDSIVIPPPIDTMRFKGAESDDDFYLILSRLAPYKRLDLAVEACKRLGRRLIVIGDGPARRELESIAGPQTEFLGRADDEVVADYAGRCKALFFPGEEDFGMTPLEINAAGRPVIAYRAGGATETVVENKTGVFFDEQEPESLMAAIEDFERRSWDPNAIRRHAERFGREVFASSIVQFVESALWAWKAKEIAAKPAPSRLFAPNRTASVATQI